MLAVSESLTRRERERLMRRREILEAARAVFAEKGYTNATLDEVAQRAEYGKGTIYNYFDSKDDLLLAIFDEMYDETLALIHDEFSPELLEDRTLREAFHDFVTAYMAYFLERRDLFLILVKEAYRMVFSDDREKAGYFMRQRERLVGGLAPTLQRAIDRGEMKPLPVEAVAHMILGNVNGLQMHVVLEEDASCDDPLLHAPEVSAKFLTTMLFDGLVLREDQT